MHLQSHCTRRPVPPRIAADPGLFERPIRRNVNRIYFVTPETDYGLNPLTFRQRSININKRALTVYKDLVVVDEDA